MIRCLMVMMALALAACGGQEPEEVTSGLTGAAVAGRICGWLTENGIVDAQASRAFDGIYLASDSRREGSTSSLGTVRLSGGCMDQSRVAVELTWSYASRHLLGYSLLDDVTLKLGWGRRERRLRYERSFRSQWSDGTVSLSSEVGTSAEVDGVGAWTDGLGRLWITFHGRALQRSRASETARKGAPGGAWPGGGAHMAPEAVVPVPPQGSREIGFEAAIELRPPPRAGFVMHTSESVRSRFLFHGAERVESYP